MRAIAELSRRYGLIVIEEAAHAVGAHYAGRLVGCGEFAAMTVFSFHPVKVVTISTDDEKIAQVARAFGTEVPFIRPAELADLFTGTVAVIQHAIEALDRRYDFTCCIYATVPLLQARVLREGLEALQAAKQNSYAFSVCGFGFPVQRALLITPNGSLDAMHRRVSKCAFAGLGCGLSGPWPVLLGPQRGLVAGEVIFSPQSLPVILPRHLVQDIDTEEDWLGAGYLYTALKANGELE